MERPMTDQAENPFAQVSLLFTGVNFPCRQRISFPCRPARTAPGYGRGRVASRPEPGFSATAQIIWAIPGQILKSMTAKRNRVCAIRAAVSQSDQEAAVSLTPPKRGPDVCATDQKGPGTCRPAVMRPRPQPLACKPFAPGSAWRPC